MARKTRKHQGPKVKVRMDWLNSGGIKELSVTAKRKGRKKKALTASFWFKMPGWDAWRKFQTQRDTPWHRKQRRVAARKTPWRRIDAAKITVNGDYATLSNLTLEARTNSERKKASEDQQFEPLHLLSHRRNRHRH